MKQRWLLTAGLCAALLCGCGSSHSSAATEQMYYTGGSEGGYMASSSYDAKNAEEAEAAESTADAGSGAAEIAADPVLSQEKLVYTGDLTIQTLEYDKSLSALRAKVKELGGIVGWENESDSNYRWYDSDSAGTRSINMTLRIPTENFETFMNDAGGIGKVISRSTGVQNISRQYNDTTVQIEALEKQQERLLEMMDKAETIEDMIAVETRLTEVQSQLNSLKTYRQSMDTDVMYSTVTVSMQEVREYVHVNESFIERAWNSFVSGWKNFIWFLEDFFINVLYALPYILIIGGLIFTAIKKNWLRMPKFSFLKRRKKDVPEEEKES